MFLRKFVKNIKEVLAHLLTAGNKFVASATAYNRVSFHCLFLKSKNLSGGNNIVM